MCVVGFIYDENDFIREVKSLQEKGWNDPDYMARQIVDDHYRHTKVSLHETYQHIVEAMVKVILDNTPEYKDIISKCIVVFQLR